jgi:hypothetical protein
MFSLVTPPIAILPAIFGELDHIEQKMCREKWPVCAEGRAASSAACVVCLKCGEQWMSTSDSSVNNVEGFDFAVPDLGGGDSVVGSFWIHHNKKVGKFGQIKDEKKKKKHTKKKKKKKSNTRPQQRNSWRTLSGDHIVRGELVVGDRVDGKSFRVLAARTKSQRVRTRAQTASDLRCSPTTELSAILAEVTLPAAKAAPATPPPLSFSETNREQNLKHYTFAFQ